MYTRTTASRCSGCRAWRATHLCACASITRTTPTPTSSAHTRCRRSTSSGSRRAARSTSSAATRSSRADDGSALSTAVVLEGSASFRAPLTGEMTMLQSWRRPTAAIGALLASVLGLTACDAPTNYVSLGDSYTSGPLIPVQRDDPGGCLRSTNNYPSVAARSVTVNEHRDPSCSGAQTKDMTAPQDVEFGPNPPQFDSLDANTTVVTLGIGGNDLGFT